MHIWPHDAKTMERKNASSIILLYVYEKGSMESKKQSSLQGSCTFYISTPNHPCEQSDLHTIFHLILILDSSKNKMNVLFPYPHLTLHSSSASSTVTLFLTPSLSPSVLAPTSAAVGSAELGAGEDTSTPPACPCPCLALPDADPDPDLCFLIWV